MPRRLFDPNLTSLSVSFSVAASAMVIAMTACQSMPNGRPAVEGINTPKVSGDPCKQADWFEIGRIDGLNGVALANSAYVGRCQASGTVPNFELYNAGWERGLVEYCTPERGYDAGRAGESYGGVCPKNAEAKFLKRYKIGIEIADLERKSAALEGLVDRKLSELAEIDTTDMAKSETDRRGSTILEDALSRNPATEAKEAPEVAAKKAELRSEIRKLRDDLVRNETAIIALEKSL